MKRQYKIFFMSIFIFISLSGFSASRSLKEEVSVLYVADGDTILVSYQGEKEWVRFIGIDAPESKKNRRAFFQSRVKRKSIEKIIQMGKSAKYFIRDILKKGDFVYLKFDKERRDRYGRLLAYVYLENGKMLNRLMLKKGLAWTLFVKPNLKYKAYFKKTARVAREKRLGIWR